MTQTQREINLKIYKQVKRLSLFPHCSPPLLSLLPISHTFTILSRLSFICSPCVRSKELSDGLLGPEPKGQKNIVQKCEGWDQRGEFLKTGVQSCRVDQGGHWHNQLDSRGGFVRTARVCVRALERMCICQRELATERGCCTRGWDSGRLKAEMFCPLPRSLMRNKRGRPAAFIGRRVKRILFVQRRTLEHIIFRWKGRSYWERKGKWLKMRVREQRKRKNGTTLQRAPLHYTTH